MTLIAMPKDRIWWSHLIVLRVRFEPQLAGKSSFKDVLLQDLYELGGEAGRWLSPNPPPVTSVVLATLDARRAKKVRHDFAWAGYFLGGGIIWFLKK